MILSIGIVTATLTGVIQNNKIIDIKSDSTIWEKGFRTTEELTICEANKNYMTTETYMKCKGFKALP